MPGLIRRMEQGIKKFRFFIHFTCCAVFDVEDSKILTFLLLIGAISRSWSRFMLILKLILNSNKWNISHINIQKAVWTQ